MLFHRTVVVRLFVFFICMTCSTTWSQDVDNKAVSTQENVFTEKSSGGSENSGSVNSPSGKSTDDSKSTDSSANSGANTSSFSTSSDASPTSHSNSGKNSVPEFKDEGTVFGPEKAIKSRQFFSDRRSTNQSPQRFEFTFSASVEGDHYLLRIQNPDEYQGQPLITPRTFELNGENILRQPVFQNAIKQQSTGILEIPVSLSYHNQINMELIGETGSGLVIDVVVMNKQLSEISIALDSDANDSGSRRWGGTRPTLSCSDALAGCEDQVVPSDASEEDAEVQASSEAIELTESDNEVEIIESEELSQLAELSDPEVSAKSLSNSGRDFSRNANGEWSLLGPEKVIKSRQISSDRRSKNPSSQEFGFTFNAPVEGGHYLLRVQNSDGYRRQPLITPHTFELNGENILRRSRFQNAVKQKRRGILEIPINLSFDNQLSLELVSQAGSGLVIEVVGMDKQRPEISVEIDSDVNDSGWRNADATVTFTCTDGLSDIASCTDPVVLSEDGFEIRVPGEAIDLAENLNEIDAIVNLDQTLPEMAHTHEPAANDAGWNNEAVIFDFSCTDNLSGVVEEGDIDGACPDSFSLSGEGENQLVDVFVQDIADNRLDYSVEAHIDLTAPLITGTISHATSVYGWHNADVTVTYSCSDALSGVSSCSDPSLISTEAEDNIAEGAAIDLADNQNSVQYQIKLDKTAPEMTHTHEPAANDAGWNNEAVIVDFSCTDNLSGVVEEGDTEGACPDSFTLSGEGENQLVDVFVQDIADNRLDYSVEAHIDLTAPLITGTISHATSVYGWHNADVTVTYSCSDALSGVSSCSDPSLISTEAEGNMAEGAAIDLADNQNSVQYQIKLDKTAPVITASLSTPANEHDWHAEPVEVIFSCEDSLSGIVECPLSVTASDEGYNRLIFGTVFDQADNQTEVSVAVNLDQTAPVLSFFGLNDGSLVTSDSPEFTLIANDNLSLDVDTLSLSVDGSPATCTLDVAFARCPSPMTLPDGEIILTASVSDHAGNFSEVSIRIAVDTDNDGVANQLDLCPMSDSLSSTGEVDDDGCVEEQRDDDGDGVVNGNDLCLSTATGTGVELDGCDPSQRDTDGDGVIDLEDSFPDDASEFSDLDNDGIGDVSDEDRDGDEFTNLVEETLSSDPDDTSSYPALTVVSYFASNQSIDEQGEVVDLAWEVQGALSVSVINDVGEADVTDLDSSGILTLSPEVTTNYSLTITGPDGQLIETLKIDVDLPAPASLWPDSVDLSRFEEQVGTSLAMNDQGESYVGSYSSDYFKIDMNGQLEWVLSDMGVVTGQAVFYGDDVFIGADTGDEGLSSSGRVYRLDEDGTVLWSYDTETAVIASPAISEDGATLYVLDYEGQVYALDAGTGGVQWQYELPDEVRLSAEPTLVEGSNLMVVHTTAGELYALSMEESPTSRVVWQRELD